MAIRDTANQSATPSQARGFTRRGQFSVGPLTLVMLLSLTVSGGGYWWWISQSGDQGATNAILHTMIRDNFVLEVIERGEIQSAGLNEVRSLVKSRNTGGVAILRIVPEGTKVKEGDFLVELDSSTLKEDRISQQIVVTQVSALLTEARNLYETAEIAKREYLDGIYVQERQIIESEVFVAEENLNRAKEYYEYSKKLAAKGYVNELQLEADQFGVEKSAKELAAAKTKLMVLDDYTRAKMVKLLESDTIITKAKWEAQEHSYELELGKLQDIEEQIGHCTILAPRDGIVLYAHGQDRRGSDSFIVEEGVMIRERQPIIRLPDPTSMIVEITINESLIQFVKTGLPVKVKPVGLGDLVLNGTVEKVNQFAEASSWRRANVKEYKALVAIDDTSPDLRAGLTASVVIRCVEVPDALQTPVQAVYSHGNQFYCFVFDDGIWEARKVECGPTNDRFFVIESGLVEGERIALNPRGYLDQVSLPELPPEQLQRAVAQPSDVLAETEGQQRRGDDEARQQRRGDDEARPQRRGDDEARPQRRGDDEARQQRRGAGENNQTPARQATARPQRREANEKNQTPAGQATARPQRREADENNQTPPGQATARQPRRGADENNQTPARPARDGQRLRD